MPDNRAVEDPYADLPEPVLAQLERLTKAATALTIGTAVSLFVPVGFLFVITFGVLKLVESNQLSKQFPSIVSPMTKFPGKSKSEVKALAMSHGNLKKVMEFSDARKAFWVVIILPIVLFTVLFAVIASVL